MHIVTFDSSQANAEAGVARLRCRYVAGVTRSVNHTRASREGSCLPSLRSLAWGAPSPLRQALRAGDVFLIDHVLANAQPLRNAHVEVRALGEHRPIECPHGGMDAHRHGS